MQLTGHCGAKERQMIALGGKLVVYLDIVFLVNFMMDFAILWAVSRFGQFPASLKRLLFGALVGAMYSLSLFIPEYNFLTTMIIKFLFSAAIIAVTFAPLRSKGFFTALAYFYLVSFVAGGAMFGSIYFLSQNQNTAFAFNNILSIVSYYFWPGLLLALLAALIVGRWGTYFLRKMSLKQVFRVPIKIKIADREVKLEALIDTGNQLKDPITQIPVIVVEYKAIKDLFSPEIQKIFISSTEDVYSVLQKVSDHQWAAKFRLIPFSSLGKQYGMLLGIKPDSVTLYQENTLIFTKKVIIGIYHRNLSPEGDYKALINPEILQKAANS